MPYSYFNIGSQRREDWEKLCPENEYRVTDNGILVNVLPQDLLVKVPQIVMISSGSTGDSNYYMANLQRIDGNDVDEMPFGLVFVGSSAHGSGVLWHHAKYPGRSTPIPAGLVSTLQVGSPWSFLPFGNTPPNSQGKLTDLQTHNQQIALQKIFAKIQSDFPIT